MIEFYIIGWIAVVILLFASGLGVLIRGYRKYDFHIMALLVPFVGAMFSFPIYYVLKEQYLKKNNAPAEKLKQARRLTLVSFVFAGAVIALPLVTGIWFFLDQFAAIDAGKNMDPTVWTSRLFWGNLTICVAYAVSLLCMGRRKR